MPISTPSQIVTPWAESGLKNAIPQNADPINGLAGFDQGFPAINMVPKTAGGIPPFGQDFNGIFYDLTVAMQYLQAGGSFPYDGVWATAVGGYPVGALVSRTDNQGLWRNTVANNVTDPEAGGAGWQPEGSGSTSVTMTSSNVTLTALEASRSIIVISGTLTANLNLIFPPYIKQWTIKNQTSGAFTITAKTASGTGAQAVQGESNSFVCDGVDLYKVSGANVPDASETVKGILKLATQALTDAWTDDLTAVTPKKLGNGFAISLAASGYIKLPSWLGGLIIQWGETQNATVTFPLAFPNAVLQRTIVLNDWNSASSAAGAYTAITSISTTGFTVASAASGLSAYLRWIVIGR